MKKVIASKTFKTDWFAKAAREASISDTDLCKAIELAKENGVLVEICHGKQV